MTRSASDQPARPQAIIVPVGDAEDDQPARRVRLQRGHARYALQQAATLCGAPQHGWRQDDRRVPLPLDGWYWSIAHTRRYAAAVVARSPVGIDIEGMKPRRQRLFDELGTETEWRAMGERTWPTFFRLWTAKEATLKANGFGISKLLDCHVGEVVDRMHLRMMYADRGWHVEQLEHDGHIAAVALDVEPGVSIDWHILEPADLPLPAELELPST